MPAVPLSWEPGIARSVIGAESSIIAIHSDNSGTEGVCSVFSHAENIPTAVTASTHKRIIKTDFLFFIIELRTKGQVILFAS